MIYRNNFSILYCIITSKTNKYHHDEFLQSVSKCRDIVCTIRSLETALPGANIIQEESVSTALWFQTLHDNN